MPESLVGHVPATWMTTSLGELCTQGGGDIQTGPFGSQLHAADYVRHGVPSVMPQNIGDNVIIEAGIARITREDATRLSRYALHAGDIVYSRRGDVERRALIRAENDGWLCGTGCLRIRLGSAAIPQYMSYYLGHPAVRAWIVRHAVGATMPNLNTKILGAVPVVVPPRAEQEAVAEVLAALDDKIALNEQVSVTLRNLGKALFDRAINSMDGQVVSVSSVSSTIMRGGAPTYVDDPNGMVVLNQKCIRAGRVDLSPARRTISAKVRADRVLKQGDVLVNSTGVGTLGRVAIWSGDIEATCDSHISIVRANPEVAEAIVVGFAILCAQPEIEELGEGSTGQTELSRQKLGQLMLTLPSRAIQTRLAETLDALERRSDIAMQENDNLAMLRDTLLPQLISGVLRIRDAERLVSDAV